MNFFFSSVSCLLQQLCNPPLMQRPDSASELPVDSAVEILSRLPVKELLRFKSVCRQWRRLIESPSFINHHLHQSANRGDGGDPDGARSLLVKRRCRTTGELLISLLSGESLELISPVDIPPHMYSPKLEVVGSCNGVVCLSHDCASDFGSPIFLWNPATREHLTLPKCVISRESLELPEAPCVVAHGFGYHRAIDDYKVVRIAFENQSNRPCFRAEVYALREGSWKEVPALPCRVYSSACIALNGILYWDAYNCGSNDVELVLSFDLQDEVFGRIYLPDLGFSPDGNCTKLTVYEESLCLIAYNFKGRAKCLDFWVMYGGVGEESWTKRLSIGPVIGVRRPMGCGANGEILVEKSNGALAIYEESSETVRDLPVKGFPYSLDIHFYIDSLVPVTR